MKVDCLDDYELEEGRFPPAWVFLPRTSLQWEESGGQRLNFKVMSIMFPQLAPGFSQRTRIIHGTTD